MPQPTSRNSVKTPQPSQPSNLPSNEVVEQVSEDLTPINKSAGKPLVRANTGSPNAGGSGERVTYPGLGKVTLVIH